MAIEVDGKMSLEVFSESAGCDFFKESSMLVASKALTSHAAVD
jgi:hypothetical protein